METQQSATRFDDLLASPVVHFAGAALLAALLLVFAITHVTGFMQTGKPSLLLFCIAETTIAACLLLRTQPRSVSRRPVDWLVAIVGTYFPLLLRPTGQVVLPGAEEVLMIGAVVEIAGAISLNRSYALVPALREVKTRGMYAVVRHPLYASYLLTLSAYVAGNFSMANVFVLIASVALLVIRIHFEERHLAQDPGYREYQGRVRWRLIPMVF